MEKPLIDTLWVLMAGALVFLMQPGFMCLESGLTRAKNSINVAIKNLADFLISLTGFWIVGYGLMFGASASGLIGTNGFFLPLEGDTWQVAFFFFQAMFCGTATTIFSGAVAERMRFSAYAIVAAVASWLIYPLFGHWAWGGLYEGTAAGWLAARGFVDFAGSTVVHSVGGWISLAALVVIGPRTGRFAADGTAHEMHGSNVPLSVLGALLLWFGWFGFNGGSTLAMNAEVPGIIARTTLAGAVGGLSCMLLGWRLSRVPKVAYVINGSLGGLVAITANCHCVDATGAFVIGAVSGPVCIGCEWLLLKLRVDDAIGAVPVHLGCGIWGTLAVALFGDPQRIGTGLGLAAQLQVQLEGVLAAFAISFVLPWLIMRGIDRIHPLRVSAEDEDIGLNISEHGARSDLVDLFSAMDRQAATGDLSLRVPEEPFTEVGHIARRYNQVMDALQEALAKTEAVFTTARDAIVTFAADGGRILAANPAAPDLFGRPAAALAGYGAHELFADPAELRALIGSGRAEVTGRRADGATFPMEAVVSRARAGRESFLVGTFRDISARREAEREIRESETRYRSFFENTGTAIFVDDPDGTITLVNSQFCALTGQEREGIEGRMRYTELFHPDDVERMRTFHGLRLGDSNAAPRGYEVRLTGPGGRELWVYLTVSRIPGTAKTLNSMLDVTDLKAARTALDQQQAYFRQLFESSPQAIALVDLENRIVDLNAGFESMFGHRLDEVRGLAMRTLVVPEDHWPEVETFRAHILAGNPVHRETLRRHKDGRLIPVTMVGYPVTIGGEITGVYYIYSDNTERKAFEAELAHQAFHDALTGLPNRALFHERLQRAVHRSQRRPEARFAVMLVDLDGFKKINDSLGHLMGDRYLVEIAGRLARNLREVDTVARLGGDEFAILLEDYGSNREVVDVVRRIQTRVRQPFVNMGQEMYSSASIGLVLRTAGYTDPVELLRDADTAMYHAKDLGKDRFVIFNTRMHDNAVESLRLENDLREALESEQFVLQYQPIVAVEDGRLKGFEALVRWDHPTRGRIGPDMFIPLAEDTGLIVPLGRWVLREACRQMHQWREQAPDRDCYVMSVNVSNRQLQREDIVDMVAEAMEEYGVRGECLRLELTESVIMSDARRTVDKLAQLKALGVKLAVDDFGTGYSSLSYLQKFPIDSLKIDRSFISGEGDETEKLEIVRAIVSLARNMGLGVVAEGVESGDQLDRLREVECNEAQGYMFARPLDVADAFEMLGRLG